MEKELIDVLVIGAGPAGCIAASIIHQAGFSVNVIEKEIFPRFVIGESLLPHSMEGLAAGGFIETIKERKFQQKFGAKFVRGKEECDFNFSDQYTPGWSWTWQVQRASFDHAISGKLQSMGVEIFFQTSATAVEFSETHAIVSVANITGSARTIAAKFVVDASGYGRVLPRLLKMEKPSLLDPRKAIFSHIQDKKRDSFQEPERIIVLSYQPNVWSWIIPFADGTCSLGVVANHAFFEGKGTNENEIFRNLIERNEYLKNRFSDQANVFDARKLEAWSVATERVFGDRFVMVGNATEFLDPIFSSGVMFASVSSHLAAKLIITELRGEVVNWEDDYEAYIKAGVDVFRSYVNAWYDGTLEEIFYSSNPDPEIQRQICSVLAGYVWDQSNPYVKEHETILKRLAKIIKHRDLLLTVNSNGE